MCARARAGGRGRGGGARRGRAGAGGPETAVCPRDAQMERDKERPRQREASRGRLTDRSVCVGGGGIQALTSHPKSASRENPQESLVFCSLSPNPAFIEIRKGGDDRRGPPKDETAASFPAKFQSFGLQTLSPLNLPLPQPPAIED